MGGKRVMQNRRLSTVRLERYETWLRTEEKSKATIDKYLRDVGFFRKFVGEDGVTKEKVLGYKQYLMEQHYAPSSINSMLSAVNSFLAHEGWIDCEVKTLRIQRQVYSPESKELSKEDYVKLVQTARKQGNQRMELLLQTVCCTGIRISELQYITVEAVKAGGATVSCKGKSRKIFLITDLRARLMEYVSKRGLESGPIFVTNRGNPMDRTNIWREMKQLCNEAGVNTEKVTPHNLRHLFARTFYEEDRDIAKLADVLGHSSINTTRIYIITTEREHLKCMENLQLMV